MLRMADDLLCYRSQFPILERTTYLISNSLGAMPRGVYDAMKGLRRHLGYAWGACLGKNDGGCWPLRVGDEIGTLMNAAPGFCLHTSERHGPARQS